MLWNVSQKLITYCNFIRYKKRCKVVKYQVKNFVKAQKTDINLIQELNNKKICKSFDCVSRVLYLKINNPLYKLEHDENGRFN